MPNPVLEIGMHGRSVTANTEGSEARHSAAQMLDVEEVFSLGGLRFVLGLVASCAGEDVGCKALLRRHYAAVIARTRFASCGLRLCVVGAGGLEARWPAGSHRILQA